MATQKALAQAEHIDPMIFDLRGQSVMLDSDLAKLYGVQTKALVQAVKRNVDRFPSDFMFQLTKQEVTNLRSQTVTPKTRGGRRTLPYAFTEEGVAMLSGVLRSERAVVVNIEIMRAFVRMRRYFVSTAKLERQLATIEGRVSRHDIQIKAIFDALRQLIKSPQASKPRPQIGFRTE